MHGRLLALPSESRDFLLAAAAHAHPTISVVEAASGIDRSAGLLPALEARVVDADGDRLRFTHPLLAAGAYATSEQARRREVHARLADLLDDPEARAWQLAASVDSADDDVAEALEQAAVHAQRRGALRPAALMLDRASELTTSVRAEDAVRRAVDAAYLHFESGDSRHAETQLRSVIAPLEAGAQRARALAILARIRLYEAPSDAADLFAQVVEESGGDPRTLAVAHEGIASCHIWRFEGFRELLRHSEIALALADELGDEALVADALMAHLSAEALLGLPSATATAERAVAMQGSAADRRVLDQPLGSVVEYWTWVDSHDRGRTALLDLLQRARDLGDENAPPWLLCLLGDIERISGRLETALVCARDGREAAEQSGQHLFATRNVALESLVLAELGRPDLARDAARRVLDANPDNFALLVASAALGHLGLALGTPAETVAPLERCLAFVRLEEIVEPGAARFVIDLVEALIALDRSAEAVEVLDWYEHNALQLDRVSALASCLRCRGLLAAQAGDLDAAFAAFGGALSRHVAAEIPLDRARTLLALGVSQRRARRRREARATLESALSVFASIGAALWVERARGELRRISGRAPAAGTLTPAEERVAALVAEGKTNREVAAALFLSDRTVEGHLSRIFRKLGVRHRAELGRAISARQSQGIAGSNTGESPISTDSAPP